MLTRVNNQSRTESHFYGTEYEIMADFGPDGNTEKNWADYEQLLRAKKNIVASAIKLHNIFLNFVQFASFHFHKNIFKDFKTNMMMALFL